tara:strand:+ start:1060 stop:1611 length:552 start_codon:yes stop_codon:yes gene_type:complete
MKKIIACVALLSLMVSCTKDLGTLQNVSTKDFKTDQQYELALKQQSFTANSLEASVDLALKSVPNSSFLKNTKISSKGKKITIVTDVWSMSKRKPEKNKDLQLNKYKKPKGQSSQKRPSAELIAKLKKGMQVTWDHPKAGVGSGVIVSISDMFAQIEKVLDKDGKPGKSVKLPLEVLKPAKRR